jgi:Predicted integral membrane protein (DUF2269)
MRNALLFIHIVGVAAWLGGGAFSLISDSTAARLQPPAAAEALKTLEKRAGVYFGVAAGLVILSGIGLVLTSEAYGWSSTFVLIGLGAFVVSGIIQSTVGKKNNSRLIEAATSGVDVEPAVKAWQRGSLWDFAILFVAIWAMITKIGA